MSLTDLFKSLTSQINPRGTWVLVRAQEAKLTTKSGIVVEHDAIAAVRWGEVLAVGPDVENLQPGQLVCWPEFTGLEHQSHDRTYFLRESELVASGDAVLEGPVGDSDPEPPNA